MLEAKVIYLNNVITQMNKEATVSDGGSFDKGSSEKTTTKTRR